MNEKLSRKGGAQCVLAKVLAGWKAGQSARKFQPAITDCKATQHQATWPPGGDSQI